MEQIASERQVSELWRRQAWGREEMLSEAGDTVRVISPGRLNDEQGPDFRDAVIELNDDTLRGDVEIHTFTRGWREHGHGFDPAYNRVILHVVMHHDAGEITRLGNGSLVPVLALNRYAETRDGMTADDIRESPCSRICVSRSGEKWLIGLLDEAGEARFREKTARFEEDISRAGAGQSLYRAACWPWVICCCATGRRVCWPG